MLTLSRAKSSLWLPPSKRVEIARTQDEAEKFNGVFECNEEQFDFITDGDTSILALIGGIGSGKSWALARWFAREQWINRGTGTIGAILANTYEQLSTATLPHLWDAYEQLGLRYGDDYVFNEAPPRFWTDFRSRFRKRHTNVISVRRWGQAVARSLENYQGLRGIELGFVGQDEARNAKPDSFPVILGRLRCKKARRILYRIATSPNGFDWLYDELVDKPDHNPELRHRRRVIFTATERNTHLPPEYLEALKASYDERFAKQELLGQFVNLTQGQVYHAFDRRVHVLPLRASKNLGWEVCFDFNRNPMCCVLTQTAPARGSLRPKVYAIHEIVLRDSGTEQACSEAIKYIGDTEHTVAVYGDPAGNHRDTRSNASDYDIIRKRFSQRYGARFRARWRRQAYSIEGRVNAVNGMFKNSNGEMSFFINESCRALRRDFERVVYKEGGSEFDKTTDKTLTHVSDAVGYRIVEDFPIRKLSGGRMNL